MDEFSPADLTQRLDRLEQENRWWRRLVLEKLRAPGSGVDPGVAPESAEPGRRRGRSRMAPGEYIASVIGFAEAARDHRERLAALGAIVYAVLAMWLLLRSATAWREYSRAEAAGALVLLVALGWLGLAFVRRQLRLRREAGTLATAARNLATRWLRLAPGPRDLRAQHFDAALRLPRALCEEVLRVRESDQRRPRRRETLLLVAAVLLWVAALLRVFWASAWGEALLAALSPLWAPPPG
jgi:hypothetical protein